LSQGRIINQEDGENKMITLGASYKTHFLREEYPANILTHKIKKTEYGYKILHMTHYITTTKTKLIINQDGTAKATSKVDKNYHRPYQFTMYFDKNGYEIKGETKREELNYYKKEREK
jgi:hypothetical protein